MGPATAAASAGPPSTAAATTRAAVLDRADRESLRDTLRRAVARARRTQRPVLASWARSEELADPVATWCRSRRSTQRSLVWQSAWDGGVIVALGTARDLRGRGAGRIGSVRDHWAALIANLVTGGPDGPDPSGGAGPLAVGGFAFRPEHIRPEHIRPEHIRPEHAEPARTAPGYAKPRLTAPGSTEEIIRLPDTLMWVPALQLRGTAGEAADRPGPGELRLNAVLLHDSDPEQTADALIHFAERCLADERKSEEPRPYPAGRTCDAVPRPGPDDWKQLVRRAVGRIQHGGFEKVVLARELAVTSSSPFDVPATVRRLRDTGPGTTVFALDHEEYTFLGATPEYLVRVAGRTAHTLGLAGTAPRGSTPEQDRALARELAASAKNRHEHDVVVGMLREVLRASCRHVTADPVPSVAQLPHVQHLSTQVSGELADHGTGILDLVEHLHPTPALGGHPREESLRWLAANEGLDRSWYAGVVGWTDPAGQGEFGVAIRSALLDGPRASLYAGCGIVADSDPQAEYAESCAKLRPMLSALEIE
ncbi:isochorismate synthase [Streptomyces sp. NBC_01190]|uniref:isochorismate synthase n=1 Tax=Streptomyces sp. NBC_01190 TaxID=2903767 RepID=UPI00386C87BB|nr:isochorismate synthase [Streptomyces sp. NBC_01190]